MERDQPTSPESTCNDKLRIGTIHLMPVPPWTDPRTVLKDEIDHMIQAEDLGFDSVWAAEHSAGAYGMISNPAVLLAAVAGKTKRIRLGTAVSVLPLHHPLSIAEDYAFVDQISDGRLEFGVGRGYQPPEFLAKGVPISENRERFREAFDIIRAAWTSADGIVSYEGKYFSIPGTKFIPQPLQKPHPPFWIAASSPDTVEWAGANLVRSLFTPMMPDEEFPERVSAYRRAAINAGFEESKIHQAIHDFAVLKKVFVAPTDREAREGALESILWFYKEQSSRLMFGGTPEPQPYEHYLNNGGFFWGSPDRVTDELQKWQETTGCRYLMCLTDFGGMPHEKVLKSQRLFAKNVLPRVNSSVHKI
jgi:alkanesulfonate monooxygenase SsuD/methylene tetrahydromethanopterin reductase-like flavin-dependent oxidoreductase (luciferase family)